MFSRTSQKKKKQNPTISKDLEQQSEEQVNSTLETLFHGSGSPSLNVDQVLSVRGERYGPFVDQFYMAQYFKDIMRKEPNWQNMAVHKREALDQITLRISRIIHGDADYEDSWLDIEGYAKLGAFKDKRP